MSVKLKIKYLLQVQELDRIKINELEKRLEVLELRLAHHQQPGAGQHTIPPAPRPWWWGMGPAPIPRTEPGIIIPGPGLQQNEAPTITC